MIVKKAAILIALLSLFTYLAYAQRPAYQHQLDYLEKYGQTPQTYVTGKFAHYDIVMLGEDHAVKQNLDFVCDLIPALYKAGVYTMAIEFGAQEMQHRVDSLINAKRYDEDVAREILYYYNVGWAYKEYMDIYKAAWAFNQSLPHGARRFRIINMSYRYDWSWFKGVRTPENMNKVFRKGTPDAFRYNLICKEVLDKHDKILIYTGTPHAYARYKMAVLDMNSDHFCRYDDGFLGNRLYRRFENKMFTIMLHRPFFNKPNQLPVLLSPANGDIEKIMALRGNKPAGFDLAGTPIGELRDSSAYSTGYKDFKMKDLFDGYIFLCPFSKMQGCTIDTLFFKRRSWEAIGKQQPDPDWHKANSLAEFWTQIKAFADLNTRYLSLLKNQ